MTISKLIRNEKFLFLAEQSVFSGITLVTSFVLARLSGVQKFGLFAGVVMIAYMLLSISYAAIIQPLQTNSSKYNSVSDYKAFNLWAVAVLAGITAVSVIAAGPLLRLWHNLPLAFTWAAGLYTIVFMAFDFYRKWFMVQGRIRFVLISTLILGFSHLAAFFTVWLLNPGSEALTFIMAMTFLPSIFIMAAGYGFYSIGPGSFRAFANENLKQARWLLPSSVIQWWSSNFFVMTAGIMLGSAVLGMFRLIQSVFGIFNLMLQAYENYLTPKAAQAYLENPYTTPAVIRSESVKFLGGMVLMLAALSVVTRIVLSQGAEPMEGLDTSLIGMSILYIVIILNYPVRILIRVTGRNQLFFHASVLSLAFSLMVFRYFISQWGIAGAIGGLICSQLIMMAYWQFHLIKNNVPLWKSSI